MWVALVVVLGLSRAAYSQENAGSSVANSLIECYNTTELLDTDRRLPTTVNVLIDLIRKVEDGPTAVNARELSVQLIQRFRQDGIRHSVHATNSPFSLPYSPRDKQAGKNKILLERLVPGNAVIFPNETLTAMERCSLHFMLSNSIDETIRNDEGSVCGRLSRYQRRYRRDLQDTDVDVFDPRAGPSKGNLEDDPEYPDPPPTSDDDILPIDDDDVEILARTNLNSVSECPVENGAVYTRWGAVQGGTVIAGIAAGFERQLIPTSNSSFVVDSRYAVTLAGDLSEAALYQGSVSDTISIGASGGWNSTTVPRWYFVQQKDLLDMTDAEIRAGLDGLIMGLNVAAWSSSVSSIKLSQILDMYYSSRGVFNSSIRACNRKSLQTSVAPSDVLNVQTIAFNDLLDDIATLDGTFGAAQRAAVGEKAVENFLNYLPNNLDDLSCTATEDRVIRAATEVVIVLDTAWTYSVIQPALAYLLDNLDVNKYGTNYTLISGSDCSVMVNSSRSILDFHAQYNLTVHQSYAPGFDYIRVFNDVQQMIQQKMDNETTMSGRSLLILLVPFSTTISEQEVTFIREKREYFKGFVPDVRPLVLGFGSKENYAEAVFDAAYDVFTLTTTTDASSIISAINPVITRIKEIPRRIVNPTCGSSFGDSVSSNSLDQYVEPGSINYYRVAPNYFYADTGSRSLAIRGSGYGQLVVCSSTSVTLPSQNDTSSDVVCSSILTDEVTFSFNEQCNGHSIIASCPPFYFSVAADSVSNNFRCTDSGCRFPDNLKFTISSTNFGCASSAARYMAGAVLFVVTFLVYL